MKPESHVTTCVQWYINRKLSYWRDSVMLRIFIVSFFLIYFNVPFLPITYVFVLIFILFCCLLSWNKLFYNTVYLRPCVDFWSAVSTVGVLRASLMVSFFIYLCWFRTVMLLDTPSVSKWFLPTPYRPPANLLVSCQSFDLWRMMDVLSWPRLSFAVVRALRQSGENQ